MPPPRLVVVAVVDDDDAFNRSKGSSWKQQHKERELPIAALDFCSSLSLFSPSPFVIT